MEIEINQYTEEEEKTLAAKLEEVAKQKQLLVRLEAFAKKEGFTDLKALLKQVIKSTNPTESTTKVKTAKPVKEEKGKAGKKVVKKSKKKRVKYSPELFKQVTALRKEGKTWKEVLVETNVQPATYELWKKKK